MSERVIIDTDPGIDDALAIVLALHSPELQISAITTVSGNVPVEVATRNVFRIMSLIPSCPRYPVPSMTLSSRNAADEILYQLAATPQPITIIALGPLTNIAAAIKKDKAAMASAKRIVLMGGAIGVAGNITPAAEFNIYVDPHAAGIVFNAGIPITMVGLDVTYQVKLTADDIAAATAAHNTTASRFLIDCTRHPLESTAKRYGESRLFLHDPLAVGVVIDPSFVVTEAMPVDIETQGDITEGMTVADRRSIHPSLKKPPTADVCIDVDAPLFTDFFLKRVLI